MKKALYIFALLALPVLSAAAADYRFHSIDVRQGLSSSTVNTMLVDSRGMLWIGTSMGLNRYDGYEVRPFRYFDAERKHPAISVDRLMEDGGGNIWIAYNGQTARYDMARQCFALDGREYFTKLGIMLPAKYQFAVSDKGNLWFVADGQIIVDLHYDEDSHAEVDMNVVMDDQGNFIEIQGTAERSPFSKARLDELLSGADTAIKEIFDVLEQKREEVLK